MRKSKSAMIGPGIFTMGVACSLLLLGCYSYYKYRQTVIEQATKEAFMEAVNDEAYKRTSNMELIISIDGGQLLKRDETTRPVYCHDESGNGKCEIHSEKHWKNVTMDQNIRRVHSHTFDGEALDPDSLNSSWQSCLKKKKIECRTGICMFSTNEDEEIISLLTSDRWWRNLHPFWACTIGYRCEVECLLYLQYSIWQVLGLAEIGCILLCLFLIMVIYVIIFKKANTSKKMISEKEASLKSVAFAAVRHYHLGGNIYFDAEKRRIQEGGEEFPLMNQSAELLELFLQEDNHILSVNAIGESLWDADGNCENRVYQAVNRLRISLKQIPSLSIDRISVGVYRLNISEV